MKYRLCCVLIACTMLSNCAILGSPKLAAACQVADGATTYYALNHGATELNPLIGGNPAFILLLKLTIAYVIWHNFPEPKTTGDKVWNGAIAAVGCIPAAHNLKVIQALKK